MCAINGTVNLYGRVKHPLSLLDMGDATRHRGPDFSANYLSPKGNVAFNHRRLSLVGLDGRATVMSIPRMKDPSSEIALCFNGEIYNYRELKKYFAKRGYISVSPSDFEVIIFAFQEWGDSCVDHLVGEFAFVLHDDLTGKVFVARDRTGVRPLFYTFSGGEFIFSSEVKGVLKYPGVSNKISGDALAEFVLMSHSFAAGSLGEGDSFYQGIRQIPAGHYGVLRNNSIPTTPYWAVPFKEDVSQKSAFHKYNAIYNSLVSAVNSRIPDEVPIALTLSGGLDSSIVASIAAMGGYKETTGFCVRYSDEENEDYHFASKLADDLGIKIRGVSITPEVMMETINRAIVANDGPVDSIRRLAMLLNYEAIRSEGFKCALIGEGSDEFNLGYYHSFPGLKQDQEICKDKGSLIRALLSRSEHVKEFFDEGFLSQIPFGQIAENITSFYDTCKADAPLKKMQYFYATRFLSYLQDGNDRAAMANSIEARVPFVDPAVVEACLDVPTDDNVDSHDEKKALKFIFKEIIPPYIIDRRKSAFPASRDKALYRLINKELKTSILKAHSEVWGILNRSRIEKLSNDFSSVLAGDKGGAELSSWLPLSSPVELRVNQVFTILTTLRWMDIAKPEI